MFLLALSIVEDLGAILVIAVFGGPGPGVLGEARGLDTGSAVDGVTGLSTGPSSAGVQGTNTGGGDGISEPATKADGTGARGISTGGAPGWLATRRQVGSVGVAEQGCRGGCRGP